jgi:hypothetical protein
MQFVNKMNSSPLKLRHFLVLMGVLGLFFLAEASRAQTSPEAVNLADLGTVSIGGHVHTLATSLDQSFQGGNESDSGAIDINSVELGLTASPMKHIDANIVWLREEAFDNGAPGDAFAVDQAYVTIAGNNRVLANREARDGYDAAPYYVKAGKMYSPFGTQMAYHTFDVVSEPQTLALAETLESSVLFGYTPSDRFKAYAGVFSGDGADSEGGSAEDAEIDDYVVGFDFTHEFGSFSAQATNNINNSIALNGELGNAADANAGLSLYGSIKGGPVTLQVAHVRAMDEYERGALADSEPTATTVELTYSGLVDLDGRPVDGTLVYERTDEWTDHPADVYGAVIDVPVTRGVTGSVEYINRDYDREFSTGLEDEELIAARLSVGFNELLSEGS